MDIKRLSNLKKYIPKEVNDFITEVAENNKGVNVYLGGGYLRDLALEKQPKDIDIFLAPKEGWCGIEYIPVKTSVTYRKTTKDESIRSDLEARNIQMLTGLWSRSDSIEVRDIQYITYKNEMTLKEVAEDFDMGICQIAYDPLTKDLYYTENFLKGHAEKVIECFHSYSDERTLARFERMESKFPDYKVVGKPSIKNTLKMLKVSRKRHSNSI